MPVSTDKGDWVSILTHGQLFLKIKGLTPPQSIARTILYLLGNRNLELKLEIDIFMLTLLGKSNWAFFWGSVRISSIISDCPIRVKVHGNIDSGVAEGPSSRSSTVAEVCANRPAIVLPPAPEPTARQINVQTRRKSYPLS